jgi:hypothetical protein
VVDGDGFVGEVARDDPWKARPWRTTAGWRTPALSTDEPGLSDLSSTLRNHAYTLHPHQIPTVRCRVVDNSRDRPV